MHKLQTKYKPITITTNQKNNISNCHAPGTARTFFVHTTTPPFATNPVENSTHFLEPALALSFPRASHDRHGAAAKTPGFSPRMPGPVVVNMKILVPGSRTENILGGNITNHIRI